MTRISVEVENDKEVMRQFSNTSVAVQKAMTEVQQEHTKELYDLLVDTSPVDTGYYQGNWDMRKDQEGFIIVNNTWYGPYLIYPNARMKGLPQADKPSTGILHNVRGYVHEANADYQKDMISDVKDALRTFGKG